MVDQVKFKSSLIVVRAIISGCLSAQDKEYLEVYIQNDTKEPS